MTTKMQDLSDYKLDLKVENGPLCDNDCCYEKDGNVFSCSIDQNYFDRVNVTEIPKWDLALRWSYTITVLFFGVIGNSTVILILLRNRLLLRATVNHFILNMSIADLILSLIGPVQFTIMSTSSFWPFGEFWCKIEGFLQSKYIYLPFILFS